MITQFSKVIKYDYNYMTKVFDYNYDYNDETLSQQVFDYNYEYNDETSLRLIIR